ncbi:hypothetical protein BVRB_3g053470 [Beta vulgaris subsp. vulgaris]|nr:hypothetical protein BVRB_3g053470 [Beta vulgaris subsp. vulgaris]
MHIAYPPFLYQTLRGVSLLDFSFKLPRKIASPSSISARKSIPTLIQSKEEHHYSAFTCL